MKTGTTVPYATRRINEHILRFTRLYDDLRGAKVNERWLADVEARDNIFPADRLPDLRQLIAASARRCPPAIVSRSSSSRPSARPSPRPAVSPTSRARCRRRCARCGIDVRVVMPLYAGHALERARARWRASCPCRCGGARRAARVRLGQAARQRRARSTSSSTTATSTARTSTARPAEGYPDNLERFTFLSRGALELCKALGFIPDVIHATTGRRRWCRSTSTPSSGCSRCTARRRVYSIHNLAYQGVFDGGAHVHHRPRARALQPERVRALRRR